MKLSDPLAEDGLHKAVRLECTKVGEPWVGYAYDLKYKVAIWSLYG